MIPIGGLTGQLKGGRVGTVRCPSVERPSTQLLNRGAVGDDPVARCARPPPPLPSEADIIIIICSVRSAPPRPMRVGIAPPSLVRAR
jgi:hypothetical protein